MQTQSTAVNRTRCHYHALLLVTWPPLRLGIVCLNRCQYCQRSSASVARQYITVRRRMQGHTMALRKAVEAGNAATRADLEATIEQLRAKARTLRQQTTTQHATSPKSQQFGFDCTDTRSRWWTAW